MKQSVFAQEQLNCKYNKLAMWRQKVTLAVLQ